MPNGNYLILITLAAIALLLALILAVRMHAFLALFLSSMALGLAAGMPVVKLLKSLQAGVGDALSLIGQDDAAIEDIFEDSYYVQQTINSHQEKIRKAAAYILLPSPPGSCVVASSGVAK